MKADPFFTLAKESDGRGDGWTGVSRLAHFDCVECSKQRGAPTMAGPDTPGISDPGFGLAVGWEAAAKIGPSECATTNVTIHGE